MGLLDVFERVRHDLPTARLLLVGDGPLRASIEGDVKKRSLTAFVSFLGLRDDVLYIMQSCDAFLFPSLFEGFGLVLTEANAAGLPVVASRVPGITEAVEDGTTALLHDPQDVDGMAKSVVGILCDSDYARGFAKRGRKRHAELFSTEAAVDRLIGLYQRALDTERSSKRAAA